MVSAVAKSKKPKPVQQDPEDVGGTELVRVNPDLKRMITWIVKFRKMAGDKSITSATFLDKLLREEIEVRFEPIKSQVEQIEKIQWDASQKIEEE